MPVTAAAGLPDCQVNNKTDMLWPGIFPGNLSAKHRHTLHTPTLSGQ
jgi:hypothetical protein